jgi:hypothetical protein
MPEVNKTTLDEISMSIQEDFANVLIADSDPELARFMLEILARKGIRGHLVGDKEKAIDFINRGS